MVELTQQFLDKYFEAYNCQTYHYNSSKLNDLKIQYPGEFSLISRMHHKRTKIRKNIECLYELGKLINKKVYFGDLTYDNKHNVNKETYKRKEAFEHFNSVFSAFFVVEEYGELNDRYHVHYVGIFKDDKTFKEFHSWHSFSWAEPVISVRKTSQYLCDYMVKQVPRIRRSKNMIKIEKLWQKANEMHNFCTIKGAYLQRALDVLGYPETLSDYGEKLPF